MCRLSLVGSRWFMVVIGGIVLPSGCVDSRGPTDVDLEVLASVLSEGSPGDDPVREFLFSEGVLGDPTGFEEEIIIDWPDRTPLSELPDADLLDAVREAEGRVFVGFKEPAAPALATTVSGPTGRRTARVRPVSASTIEAGRRLVAELGGTVTRPYRELPFVAAIVSPAVALELRNDHLVDWLAPERAGSVGAGVVSQVVPQNIERIRAPHAWADNRGEGARIWVLDTGSYGGFQHHPDLPQLSPYTCLTTVPGESDCEETVSTTQAGHGTAVAGVAMALDNSIDVVGVAPSVSVYGNIQVCDNALHCTNQSLVDAVEFLRQNGFQDIVNMSLCLGFNQATATAVAAAFNSGDLLVGIAGNVASCHNAGAGSVTYPAAYSQVIAVSGTTLTDGFHSGSAWGSEVELSAPFCVLSLGTAGGAVQGVGEWCGTSFAAPAVSGTAALIWTKHPGWTNGQVRTALQNAVVDLGPAGRDEKFGFGRIDACKAVGLCPFVVSIQGPSSVRPGEPCTWFASVSGGQGPFSYQWSGMLSGTGQQITGSLSGSGTLSLNVQSNDGQSNGDDLFVAVSSSAPSCGF